MLTPWARRRIKMEDIIVLHYAVMMMMMIVMIIIIIIIIITKTAILGTSHIVRKVLQAET
jgi:hypothetical protein